MGDVGPAFTSIISSRHEGHDGVEIPVGGFDGECGSPHPVGSGAIRFQSGVIEDSNRPDFGKFMDEWVIEEYE